MDAVLGLILDTLEAKQLTDVVNVIITSDHGMTNTDMNTRVCIWLNSPFDSCLSVFRSVRLRVCFRGVQFKMVIMRSENPICAPPLCQKPPVLRLSNGSNVNQRGLLSLPPSLPPCLSELFRYTCEGLLSRDRIQASRVGCCCDM